MPCMVAVSWPLTTKLATPMGTQQLRELRHDTDVNGGSDLTTHSSACASQRVHGNMFHRVRTSNILTCACACRQDSTPQCKWIVTSIVAVLSAAPCGVVDVWQRPGAKDLHAQVPYLLCV